jgi:hypothetical protein
MEEERKSCPLLKCPEMRIWRDKLLTSNRPHINEELALRTIKDKL